MRASARFATRLHAMLVAGVLVAAAGCGSSTPGPGPTAAPTTAPTAAPTTTTPSGTGSPQPTTPAPTTPAPTTTSPAPTTSPPTPSPTGGLPSYLAGHVITGIPTTRKVVALTFDGGSGDEGLAKIMAALAADDVPATFFLTGRFVQSYPSSVQRIVAGGYVIGNHTVRHLHLPQEPSSTVRAEVTDAAAILTAAIGRSPKPWFRFPYGESDDRTLGIVNGLGYAGIGWTIGSRGYLGTSGGTVDDIVTAVLSHLAPGAIVLMHVGANPDDGTTYDADALPRVISGIEARGYAFVTVAALLR